MLLEFLLKLIKSPGLDRRYNFAYEFDAAICEEASCFGFLQIISSLSRRQLYMIILTIISISFIALRIALPRLREKLEDKEPGVQAAAVNVICELARKNPKQYLPLSPVLLKLMNKSSNNWVLIKIIKLFGSLIQFEPRLGMSLNLPMGPERLKSV